MLWGYGRIKKAIPLQTLTGPEGSRRLRLPGFKTTSTWRWQGCQPYAPAAFTPRRLRLPDFNTIDTWRWQGCQPYAPATFTSRRLRLPDFKTIGTWRWQGCQPYAPVAFTPWRLSLPDFKTIGTWRWQGCQPYAPDAFTPRKYSWYFYSNSFHETPKVSTSDYHCHTTRECDSIYKHKRSNNTLCKMT
jgi:hypothetical protein